MARGQSEILGLMGSFYWIRSEKDKAAWSYTRMREKQGKQEKETNTEERKENAEERYQDAEFP